MTKPKYNWDPLAVHDSAATDIVTAASKREIRNILKSYVGFFDPFCELIQNSLDAVDTRKRELKEPKYKRHLWITIDLKKNKLSVTDNGVGFKEAQFRLCLSPSISFKNSGDTRGNKGVGATYLAYGFNYLQMGTKTPEYSALTEFRNGREWVDDEKASVARPTVEESESNSDAFGKVDRGSTFTLIFRGNVRPRSLNWIGATTAEQWKTLLLVKTPLGQVKKNPSEDDTLFDLEVIDESGNKTALTNERCGYVFPDSVIKAAARISDITAEQDKLLKGGKDPSKLPMKFKRLNAVYDIWETAAIKTMVSTAEEKALCDQFGVWAYGFFCYSAPKVLDWYNDETAKLRKGLRILRGGLQLATNSMPQGELITIPLTSNIGYQNQAHVVVHFDRAEPDLGRKGFQPELQKLAERISVALVNKLKHWRHLLLTDHGPGDVHQDDLKLDDWVTLQKEYEKKHPIALTHKNFFIPVNQISISAQPNSEQDVVALFNQLVAGGVIRGIQLMASSSHQQYDGLYRYHFRSPIDNHTYDEDDNPLGVSMVPQNKDGFLSKPYVLEYKHSFDLLLADFDNEEKSESSVSLAVVWKMGTKYKERYQVVSLLLPENLHLRQFHGITHEMHDDDTGVKRMDVIVLSELVAYLNDVNACEKEQEKLYGTAD
jgi:hypothetical protein